MNTYFQRIYLIAFLTLLRKETRRFIRIWIQTLLPSLITMTLYFLIFGRLIGSQLSPIQGFNYMQYIAPGLIMMSIITNAYLNTVSSLFSVRFQKSIEELLVSPLPNALLLLGFVAGGMVRGLTVGLFVTLLTLLFTHLIVHSWGMTLIIAVITTLLFSLAGFTNALFAKKFDDISIIPTFVLTPLTYLGGVFYSLSSLSPAWQVVSLFNPILYIINAFRYGILGISDIPVYPALIVSIFFCVALFGLNWYLLKKGIGLRA